MNEQLENAILIDVREPDELKTDGKIPQAKNIPCMFIFISSYYYGVNNNRPEKRIDLSSKIYSI